MLREYKWRGNTWQFEEAEAPEGAVLLVPERPRRSGGSRKAATPKKNKSTSAKNKTEV